MDKSVPTTIYTIGMHKRAMEIDAPNFQIADLYSTWGDVNVFTTFDEGVFGVRCPINSKKVFYMWDLDWHYNGMNYDVCKEIVDKTDFLYCRCADHQTAIEKYFGRKPEIMTNFNMKELYDTKNR